MNENLYHETRPISREEAESAFSSGDPIKVNDALVRIAFHDPDWKWVQTECLRFIDSANSDIQGVAITCLGHLARIHGELDIEDVIARLRKIGKDNENYGRVEDALEDIESYTG